MNRHDSQNTSARRELRTSESIWRANPKPRHAASGSKTGTGIKLKTILILMVVVLVLVQLYTMQPSECRSSGETTAACVD